MDEVDEGGEGDKEDEGHEADDRDGEEDGGDKPSKRHFHSGPTRQTRRKENET